MTYRSPKANCQSAFTLIELLVVIAIIAILAAILFPVFAQAKSAAKKVVSISNTKQLILACMMYDGDYDDTVVLALSESPDGAPAFIGPGIGYQPWSWLILPYMKNTDILQDPQAPPIVSLGAGWSDTTSRALAPEYGMNSTYLSPLMTSAYIQAPVSDTAIANPSETVFITAKFGNGETNLPPNSFYWYLGDSVPTTLMIDPPDCNLPIAYLGCYRGWGTGDLYDHTYLMENQAAGSRTGGMSLRGVGLAIVAWADGHASAKSPGYMAQGTNWTPNAVCGTVVITDLTKYLWDIQ